MSKDNPLLTKDTIIKTNLITVIGVITTIVAAFVSYTVAINRIANAEQRIGSHDARIEKLEADREVLIDIRNDMRWIKQALGIKE